MQLRRSASAGEVPVVATSNGGESHPK
jgi:hypothetical protein